MEKSPHWRKVSAVSGYGTYPEPTAAVASVWGRRDGEEMMRVCDGLTYRGA